MSENLLYQTLLSCFGLSKSSLNQTTYTTATESGSSLWKTNLEIAAEIC